MPSLCRSKFLIAALFAAKALRAVQQDLPEASTAGSFDTLNQSARAGALGSAFAGAPDDAASVLVNPACLGQLRTHQASLHHHAFIGDIAQEAMLVGVALGKMGGVGLNVSLVDYGTFEGRDSSGRKTHPVGASDLGVGLSWGMRMLPWLWFGSSLRSLRQTLADTVYTSYGLDLGGVAESKEWRVSFSALDYGSDVGGNARAALSRLAFSRRWAFRDGGALSAGMGFSSRSSGLGKVGAGFELDISGNLFLRASTELTFPAPEISGLRDIAVGGGLRMKDLGIDYAYRPMGELGNSHRASLAYYFREASPEAPQGNGFPPPPLALSPFPRDAGTSSGPPPSGRGDAGQDAVKVRVEEDLLEKALALLEAKDQKAAVQALSAFLQANPRHAPAWAMLGRAYYETGKGAFAEQCFEESLKLDPAQSDLKAWLERYRGRGHE